MNSYRHTVVYAAGPGNILRTFAKWQQGEDDEHQVAITYSSQFFQLCKQHQLRGVAVSSNDVGGEIESSQFRIINLPKPTRRGLRYHIAQVMYMKKILDIARQEQADFLVVSDATGHWFPLRWWAPANLKIIPTFHCTLWPNWKPIRLTQRILNRLNRGIFARYCHRILTISSDIQSQLQRLTNKHHAPAFSFIPTYRLSTFHKMKPARQQNTFRVLFAGRLEPEKGTLDLLKIARCFKQCDIHHIHLDICGDGSLSNHFPRLIQKYELEDLITYHGYCHRPQIQRLINQANAFIVPTTTDFEEGFNKTVVEAILSGRPVITSKVCPSLKWVKTAAVEVRPDDVLGYAKALIRLARQPGLYQQKQWSCRSCARPFLDPDHSWGRALERAMELA